jgi:hypothetical protein
MKFHEFTQTLSLAVAAALAMTVSSGCSLSASTTSSVVIKFPSLEEINPQSKISATSTFQWSRVCFAVNVAADDIQETRSSQCEIPLGIFAGTVPLSGELSLTIPKGNNRRLQVFTYLRASENDPCPQTSGRIGGLNRELMARVGSVDSFNALENVVNLAVTIREPAAGENLITQYSLAESCKIKPPPQGSATSRVAQGSARIRDADGIFTIDGTVSGIQAEAVLSDSNNTFQMHLSRKLE